MGTRSDIIAHCKDGKWRRIYCHWDGYLDHNGRILFDHYTSQDKAEQLIALGDLSVLAANCTKPEGHSFDHPVKDYCVAYGRDRGETETAAKVGDSLQAVWPEADTWTEFTYVWHDDGNGGRWWVASPDEGSQTLVDLGQALTGEVSVRANIKAFGMIIGTHKNG